ncbi:hypothetical protein DEU56DRAFT_919716 [Suillus clintonianus]|uniref:uncharacterized protein n=1 Tax=Suillus clintonianus TaxID=1904413 RepID=UPI001B8635FD|nr:uncharacterized protein DEU56DRAFT_919716 [Suillus clintonianus]KAG2113387.1 hypothetical protein DEU56DRAFT_919716 [Suillus clintonianus]
MRMHQQIQALASENETLKQQNNVLLASQDAYKNAFKILAASISLDICDSDITKFDGIPPGLKSTVYKPSFRRSEPLRQNDYPKTKFWTPSLYEAWKKSPSAQYMDHGTFPFLENTDGEPIENCWAALKQENRAPNTWGKAGNKILDEVAEEMARLHPILALCENGWKVHAIATERYPSWTATHLDKKKRKVHATGFDCNDRDSSKRRNVSGSTDPESDGSKSQITANEPTDSLSEPLKVKQDTLPKDATVTPALDLQNGSKSDIGTSELERRSNDPPQPPCIEVSTTLSLPVPCISLISADDSNESPEASSHANTANSTPQDTSSGAKATCEISFPIIKNPLAKLAGQKHQSVVPNPVAPPPSVSTSSSASTLPPTAPSTSAIVESISGKRFRPGTSKNGRSLCAHRWLKQIATTNGSSADFRIYWSGLTKDKQLAYETDALKLVSDDIWNRNTVDIINRFSSGALY